MIQRSRVCHRQEIVFLLFLFFSFSFFWQNFSLWNVGKWAARNWNQLDFVNNRNDVTSSQVNLKLENYCNKLFISFYCPPINRLFELYQTTISFKESSLNSLHNEMLLILNNDIHSSSFWNISWVLVWLCLFLSFIVTAQFAHIRNSNP